MKTVLKTLMFVAVSGSAFAQTNDCRLNEVRATYLSQTMAQIKHVYLCKQSGPVVGDKIKRDLTTCIFSGTSRKELGGGPAASVISKSGASNLSDSMKLGSIYGVHSDGILDEAVTISEKELKIQSDPNDRIQTEIAINLETGEGLMSSKTPVAGISVSIPMQCQKLR